MLIFGDVKIAIRRLTHQRTFAFTAIATLAIGVGATTAIVTTVNATLLRPLPYPQSEDIYTLNTVLVDGRWSSGRVAGAYVHAINESASSVALAVTVSNTEDVIITDDGGSRQALLHFVSDGFFDLFESTMAAGRSFTAEDAPSRAAVISYRIWTDVFGQDPGAVGRSLRLATGPITIVGVAPRDFDVPRGSDVWIGVPLSAASVAHTTQGYLRARPGTEVEMLRDELASIMRGLQELYPQAASGRAFVVEPLVTAIVGDLGPILLVLLAGAVLLLLLGSMNVATLVLGRGASQAKEVAVRSALGGSWWNVVRPVLAEGFVLCAIGTIAGLGLAWIGVRALLAYGAAQLPRMDQVLFDGRVAMVAIGLLAVTTVLTGLVPAVRLATPDIRGLLNEAGRSGMQTRRAHRLMSGLVVIEVALSIALVAGAGWLVRSYINLSRTNPGFEARGRLVFTAMLMGSQWSPMPVIVEGPDGRPMLDPNQPRAETPRRWFEALTERLQASGQVDAVGSANVLPLGIDWDAGYYVGIPGEPYDPEGQEIARMRFVGPTFFEAMGTRLLAGRAFSPNDDFSVAIVNESFVRRYLIGRDPLGESFAWGFPLVNFNNLLQIVGVVEDVKYLSLREPPDPIFYRSGLGPRQSVVVETTLDDPTPLIPRVRAEVAAVDPMIPVNVESLPDIISVQMLRHRIGLVVMGFFSVICLALAAVGIYGVVANVTAQRRGELATRTAFGASPSDVLALLMRQGWVLASAGGVLGLGIAYVGGRLVAGQLHEVEASDPVVLAAAASTVVTITLLAFLIPAVRASRTRPIDGLRVE